MSARYNNSGEVAAANPNTLIGLTGGTTQRFNIYDWMVGSNVTPADRAYLWTLGRSTTAGTGGTGRTPNPMDPADPAAVVACQEAPTTEPGYTANEELMEISLNMRATFRWVAAPNGELICPATASAGLGLMVTHATDTSNMQGTVHHQE